MKKNKGTNFKYKIENYDGSLINIIPATDETLQLDLCDSIETQDDLTELHQFLQEKILSAQEFDIMIKDRIGIFPEKVLLATRDGYRICGIYNAHSNTLTADNVRFSIALPEYLDGRVICIDVTEIDV